MLEAGGSPATSSSPAESGVLLRRVLAAVFYGCSSCSIMIINKSVLTTYNFPSCQALSIGQMLATLVLLYCGKILGTVRLPELSMASLSQVWPLPLFYLGNLVFGLAGTQALSLPMLTVLRRFSILITMIGEYYLLQKRHNFSVQVSVILMIFGATVAAFNDLAFNIRGYAIVLLNDFSTAGNGIIIKQKLESKDFGKNGLMFYNSLFMVIPALIVFYLTEDLNKIKEFEGWQNPMFVSQFLLSCLFGCILMFSMILCTSYNSPLTTTVIGCLKNIIITYTGMVIGGDYQYSLANFVGLNISVIGSLIYTKVVFTQFSSLSKPNTGPVDVDTSSCVSK